MSSFLQFTDIVVSDGLLYLSLATIPYAVGLLIDPDPVLNYLAMISSYTPDVGRKPWLEYLLVEGPMRMGALLALAPAGAVLLARRDRMRALALLAPIGLYAAAASRVRAGELGAYFVPVYACLALLALAARPVVGGPLTWASVGAYLLGLLSGHFLCFVAWLALGIGAAFRDERRPARPASIALVLVLAVAQLAFAGGEIRRMRQIPPVEAAFRQLAATTSPDGVKLTKSTRPSASMRRSQPQRSTPEPAPQGSAGDGVLEPSVSSI